jgi:hypothetical protein
VAVVLATFSALTVKSAACRVAKQILQALEHGLFQIP